MFIYNFLIVFSYICEEKKIFRKKIIIMRINILFNLDEEKLRN